MKFLYRDIEIIESDEPLVDLSTTDMMIEPAAFMRGYSKVETVFVRESVVAKLHEAQGALPAGYRFKVYDGFRTRDVQKKMYDETFALVKQNHPDWSDEQITEYTILFVAPADSDLLPPHVTGGAIDLTVIDAAENELDMGGAYGAIGDEVQRDFYKTSNPSIHKNRMMIYNAMKSVEMFSYSHEWWHYNFGNQAWAYELKKDFAFYGDATKYLPNNQ